ncbi:MAG: hypothetical protein AB7P20_04985 [Rhizobiaceae bacterium]
MQKAPAGQGFFKQLFRHQFFAPVARRIMRRVARCRLQYAEITFPPPMFPWSNQGKHCIRASLLQPDHIPGLSDSWQMRVDVFVSTVFLLGIHLKTWIDA